jgi:thiosulfate/3-mercaptopyruvate sulfurtransferase
MHGLTSPLVSVETLAAAVEAGAGPPDLVVVDARFVLGQPGAGRLAYDTAHIPGAIFLDIDTDLSAATGPGRHPLPEPAAFAALLSGRGVGERTFVVAYDDVGGWAAARLWWMLDDLGHRGGAAVLDGGWQAWLAAGRPTTHLAPAAPATPGATASSLSLARAWGRVIDRAALKARRPSVVLLDARSAERYRGEIEPVEAVAGHIPGARSAPTAGNLGPDGRFRSGPELRERFATLGAAGGDGSVLSCGSGVSACHNALAMRLAGLPAPLLYPGSYSDWVRSGEPVATGPEPGG